MSFNDDSVQPDQGQGGESTEGEAPYASYLNRIPEQLQGEVEPVFKDWDASVTKRFQEAADFRKQWEPLQDTGIHEYSPDEVRWLTQFRGALDNPQQIAEWYQDYASQNGLLDDNDGTSEDFQYDDDPSSQKLQALEQQLQQFQQWQEQVNQQASVHQRQEEIDQTLAELERDHPQDFNRDMIDKFVANYMDRKPAEAVKAAFGDWQKIRNDIQKSTLQNKLGMPQAPERGGLADGTAEPVKLAKGRDIWANANRIAKETFAAERAADQ